VKRSAEIQFDVSSAMLRLARAVLGNYSLLVAKGRVIATVEGSSPVRRQGGPIAGESNLIVGRYTAT
jgi:hypothetical protein